MLVLDTSPETFGSMVPEDGATKDVGPRSPTFRILVVEDDATLSASFRKRLERARFEVTLAGTLAEAQALIEDPARGFDAAILDFDLPDGDTFELVSALLERDPLCKSLVVTGRGSEAEARRYMQLGAHAFLVKPVQPSELLNAVTSTTYATLSWRLRTGQDEGCTKKAPCPRIGGIEPPRVPVDVDAVLARLRHIANLSPLQNMVAYRLIWGDSDREIARMLGCAERTAKRHVGKILAKTGARTRTGLLSVLLRDAGVEDAGPETVE